MIFNPAYYLALTFEEIVKVIEEEMKEYESRTQILHESIVSYGNC